MELPMRTEGRDIGGDASAVGVPLEGGDPALMGGHTGPTAEGAEYAQGAQDRAKAGREAQQRQLAAKTGDTLYPASGKPSSLRSTHSRQGSEASSTVELSSPLRANIADFQGLWCLLVQALPIYNG